MATHRSGRPREFDHKKRDELINHIGQGATIEEAARIVGVSLRTVQREAKINDDFHHDLALAQHDADVDPEKLMHRAARSHWRAAAWLLERSDPDRFGKRPANSCSPEKLQDIMNYLIELALEATPAEHREAVYRHMRPGADRAFDVLMPDQHESRRWTDSLATRAMPLSDIEICKLFHDPEHSKRQLARAGERARMIADLRGPQKELAEGEVYTPPPVRPWHPPVGQRQDSTMQDFRLRHADDPEPLESSPEFEAACKRFDEQCRIREQCDNDADARCGALSASCVAASSPSPPPPR
jgi:hypothetical protein